MGPDPTIALNREDWQTNDEVNSNQDAIFEYKKKYRDKYPSLKAEAYFYNHKMIERKLLKYE